MLKIESGLDICAHDPADAISSALMQFCSRKRCQMLKGLSLKEHDKHRMEHAHMQKLKSIDVGHVFGANDPISHKITI